MNVITSSLRVTHAWPWDVSTPVQLPQTQSVHLQWSLSWVLSVGPCVSLRRLCCMCHEVASELWAPGLLHSLPVLKAWQSYYDWMRRNLPYLGKRSLIALDSYGSSSWQLADENSATPSSCLCHRCHHCFSAPPLQSFIWSSWNAAIFSFFLLTIRTTKWKYKIQVSLAERGTREQDPPRESTERAEWQEGVEKHTRQFRNLYSIFSTQWKPKLHSWHSIFFWLTHHVKLINTNLSPPADRIGEMERQVTWCTTISEPCRGSHCLLVLFADIALHYVSQAL